jgi:hypothetical protein
LEPELNTQFIKLYFVAEEIDARRLFAGHDSCSAVSNEVEDGCGPENPA